jgi:AcrR family transcriptional regulator
MANPKPTRRKYEKRRRAEQQAETRRRIVEAVVALHREIGLARTTVSAIAERAGVERLTVYRHFADEGELFAACSAHFLAETGPPNPERWAAIGDAADRMRAALLEFYGYYRRGEDMIAHVRRDAPQLPALQTVLAPWQRFMEMVRGELTDAWGADDRARVRVAAIVGHALRFETWQSLARIEGLGDGEVAELMIELTRQAM